MTSPKPPDEDDPSGPRTPRRGSTAMEEPPNATRTSTPDCKTSGPTGDASPKTTPGHGTARRRAATTKHQPTLLGDFLLGRPSPARVAADKQAARERRKELEAVQQEMRQASIQQIQPPGGVRDRVKKWQMTNVAAMADADPFATPTEPSEVNVQVDNESVTEEERIRIRMRQKKKKPSPPPVTVESNTGTTETEKENQCDLLSSSPPKKRVVSDTNWVKNQKKKSPPRKVSPKIKATEAATSQPIPKDFLSRTAANPPISRKIKDWANRVEMPDDPPKSHSASRSVGSADDGIRVKAVSSENDSASGRSGSRRSGSAPLKPETAQSRASNPKEIEDDGIRVKPQRTKAHNDDGIRVRPQATSLPDDGIRVRPVREASRDASTVRASSRQISVVSKSRVTAASEEPSPSDRIEVIEDPEAESPQTPTKVSAKTRSSHKRSPRPKKPAPKSLAETGTTMTQDVSDSESWTSGSGVESDIPSSAPPKSLAEIPVGYSAFSVLDLPSGHVKRAATRPKADRQSSFKGATNVLKKALTEGKKILTEKVDPPKPVVNQPPNIENWLKTTVDPFVEGSDTSKTEPQRKSIEKEWADESKGRGSTSSKSKSQETLRSPTIDKNQGDPETTKVVETKAEETSKEEAKTPTQSPVGLKRSRATRAVSSPIRSAGKKGFKDKIRDAFRGESSGHRAPPLEYSSYEEVADYDEDSEDPRDHRRLSGSRRSASPYSDDEDEASSAGPVKGALSPPQPKRRPPTNGHHELSTIFSDGRTHSSVESDVTSMVSDTTITQTTITQSTGLTRSTAVSRKQSQKPGLKRRLTKHSDLISVLSLPDDGTGPDRRGSLRSTRSTRRCSNRPDDATLDSLLQEFADDEDLYQRELKTLVDGVVPVLLTQFVHNPGNQTQDLFQPSPSSKQTEDSMSKAVVHMGIALEKLKSHHRRCPLSSLHKLPQWLETVLPVYENYLDVWRLGFQGIIVNLTPASPDDEDSLVNAMPRNAQGDVLNEDGERIDVAHLLKRPLVRVKWITKFIEGYCTVTGIQVYEPLLQKWQDVQDKARRRHKEENARVIDDDARNLDTSRVRDLKTLGALEHVRIDKYRRVWASDVFSLDLRHSNGQRLECQVELISRDNDLFKSDPGDLLFKETGSGGRSWLLFAPVMGGKYSARRGENNNQLVVMIRGYKDEWFELITLTADDEDQITDWLDILGATPVPPAIIEEANSSTVQSLILSAKSTARDAPLGGKSTLHLPDSSPKSLPSAEIPSIAPTTPARYHQRHATLPSTPTSTAAASALFPDKTPTQESYHESEAQRSSSAPEVKHKERSRPLREGMRPDPITLKSSSPNSTPYREDGAPPPPVHRNLGSTKSPKLSPPADKNYPSIRRRGSSPLKHEYHPSDISSENSTVTSESGSDGSYTDESSDDELEATDIPDAAPAISIKKETEKPTPSVLSEEAESLTPSASASQAAPDESVGQRPEYLFKTLANISYWDDKDPCWKDLWPDICSIVITPGLIEAYPFRRNQTSSDGSTHEDRPLVALDLTPVVMLRNSTAVDIEIRSPILSYARLYTKVIKIEASFFRFRTPTFRECGPLYTAVHRARMDNAKYKALEEEARVRAFGQNQATTETGEDNSSRRRGWFGRKNSYRASARAPSQSAGSTSQSSISASSLLKKLMGNGGQSFNIAASSVDRQSRSNSRETSLYTSSSSATPRSPSVSAANSGNANQMSLTTNNLKIRLYLLVTSNKWEDVGSCFLEVTRPDQGTRQNLRKYQGMEKRVIVTTIPKKEKHRPRVMLDVVLGSGCFTRLGARGILLNVWEEVKDESGEFGVAPQGGGSGGNVSKWCFQCHSHAESNWIYGLVTQEVVIG